MALGLWILGGSHELEVPVKPGSGHFHTVQDVIVDALFGTGLNREVTGDARATIEGINRLDRADHPVIAVDVPSGLDADTLAKSLADFALRISKM